MGRYLVWNAKRTLKMICSVVTVRQVLITMKPLFKDLVMPACVMLLLAILKTLVIKGIILNALSVDLMVQVWTAKDVQAMTIMWIPLWRIVLWRRKKWKQKNLVRFWIHLFIHNSVHACTCRGGTNGVNVWFHGISTPNLRKHCASSTFPGKEGFSKPNFLKKITCMSPSEQEISSIAVIVGWQEWGGGVKPGGKGVDIFWNNTSMGL